MIIGAVIMSFGHFLMASESMLYFALAAIALGNGLFLPSLPSQIDDLYAKDDPRRGSAYNFYYVGINVGGLLAPLVCGTLGELYGWHYGFGAAGVGMLAGLAIYTLGGRWLPPERPKVKDLAPAERMPFSAMKQRILTLAAVAVCVMVFRGAYEQSGNTIALWADVGLDRSAGSYVIPMTWFQSLNPFLVIFMTPVLVAMWTKQAGRGREPAPAKKMALGAFGVSLDLLLALVDASAQGHAHWVWLAAFFVLFTAGELFILPIGLSLFARLAPAGYAATSIAAWYFRFVRRKPAGRRARHLVERDGARGVLRRDGRRRRTRGDPVATAGPGSCPRGSHEWADLRRAVPNSVLYRLTVFQSGCLHPDKATANLLGERHATESPRHGDAPSFADFGDHHHPGARPRRPGPGAAGRAGGPAAGSDRAGTRRHHRHREQAHGEHPRGRHRGDQAELGAARKHQRHADVRLRELRAGPAGAGFGFAGPDAGVDARHRAALVGFDGRHVCR